MSELDDILGIGGGGKAPKQPKLVVKGDTFVGRQVGAATTPPVHEFINGKPGEQLFWQNKKPTRFSALDKQLPFEPIKQIRVTVVDKEGTEYSIYYEGDKLKKLKQYIRENPGTQLVDGSMHKIWIDDLDETFNIPKKLWGVVVKSPKE